MTGTRRFIEETVRNLLLTSIPLALFLFAQFSLSGGTPALLRTLLLVPWFFVSLPLRRVHMRLWLHLLLTLLYVALAVLAGLLLPTNPPADELARLPFLIAVQPFFFGVFALYAAILSLYERMKQPLRITSGYFLLSEGVVLFFYLNAPADSSIRTALYILGFAILLLFMLHLQLVNFRNAMRRYIESGTMPVDRISRASNRMLLSFLFLLVVVVLLAPFGASIVNTLLNGVLSVVRFFTGLLNPDTDPEYEFTTFIPDIDESTEADMLPTDQPVWIFRVLVVILNIVAAVVAIALAALFVFMFIRMLVRFYRKFNERKTVDGDIRIRLSRTESDAVQTVRQNQPAQTRRLRKGFRARPADRVRRLFIRTVERAVKTGALKIRRTDTARTLSGRLEKNKDQDLSLLTELYEQARYGPDGLVREEDVRRVRTEGRRR